MTEIKIIEPTLSATWDECEGLDHIYCDIRIIQGKHAIFFFSRTCPENWHYLDSSYTVMLYWSEAGTRLILIPRLPATSGTARGRTSKTSQKESPTSISSGL